MKTFFNTFAISLICFSVFAQKSDCKHWQATFQDFKATMVFANNQSYFVVNQNRNYEIKKMKVLADSTIIYNDVEGLKLISLSADTMAIKARNDPSIKFQCLNDEVVKHRLNLLISLECKDIESFNSDSLFLLKYDNIPIFVDFKGVKMTPEFEKILPMDSTGFWVRQEDEWRLLDSHFKESMITKGERFSEVIKNAPSEFAIEKHDNNWGYVFGSLYIPPMFEKVLFYSHGLLPVLTKNKRWIFLDNNTFKNSYPNLSFIKKPSYKMSFWEAETSTEIFEIKEHLYRVWKKSEIKLNRKSKRKKNET